MAYLNNFNPEKVDSVPEVRNQLRFLKKAIDNGEIGSGGGGAVNSVNGKTGAVVLNAEDVGAASVNDLQGVADDVVTNTQDIATLQAAYEGLTESDIIPMQSLPASGVVNTIYRIAGTTTYSDYMWDGTDWVKLAEYDNALGTFDINETYEEIEEIEELSGIGASAVGITTSSSYKSKVWELAPTDKIFYRTGGNNIEKVSNIARKEDDTYVSVAKGELISKYPDYLETFDGLPSNTSPFNYGGDYRNKIFNNLYYKDDITQPLYLIVNTKYSVTTFNPKVYKKTTNYSTDIAVTPKDNVTLDNYDYIQARACELSDGNLTEQSIIYEKKGVVYNANGTIRVHSDYDCYVLPVKFGTYYAFYGFSGLIFGANNIAWLIRYGDISRQLEIADFVQNAQWLQDDTFFSHGDTYLYKQEPSNSSFAFKTPSAEDFTDAPDEICLVINKRFTTKNLSNDFYITEGATPKQSTGKQLVKVFGYDINNDTEEQETPSDNNIKGKIVAFFGDSITSGTDGGYVNLVKDKVQLASALNYGSSGAGTARLVDIVTGYNIRESGSYSTKDYNTFSAVTIMIGTNGGVSGNIANDIPDISISDISSYPYNYSAEGKTISSATLQNADDFFKLCFANTFYGNIALCLEYIQWKNPDCRVYLITIPPSDRGNHIAVRNAMIELGVKMGIQVIDAQANAGMGEWNLTQWSKDGTHLNYVGNEMWASYLAKELENRFYISDVNSLSE